ncbi:hypothetical protein CYLTODRAFT_410153, partial [Cylindrobasidium torrendii FP15055 ss-10]
CFIDRYAQTIIVNATNRPACNHTRLTTLSSPDKVSKWSRIVLSLSYPLIKAGKRRASGLMPPTTTYLAAGAVALNLSASRNSNSVRSRSRCTLTATRRIRPECAAVYFSSDGEEIRCDGGFTAEHKHNPESIARCSVDANQIHTNIGDN